MPPRRMAFAATSCLPYAASGVLALPSALPVGRPGGLVAVVGFAPTTFGL